MERHNFYRLQSLSVSLRETHIPFQISTLVPFWRLNAAKMRLYKIHWLAVCRTLGPHPTLSPAPALAKGGTGGRGLAPNTLFQLFDSGSHCMPSINIHSFHWHPDPIIAHHGASDAPEPLFTSTLCGCCYQHRCRRILTCGEEELGILRQPRRNWVYEKHSLNFIPLPTAFDRS